MVRLSTKVCFDITLERKRKPSEETIRLRIRKKT